MQNDSNWSRKKYIERFWTIKILLPRSLVNGVLKPIHEQFGHVSYTKMQGYLKQYLYWKYMRRDVKRYTRLYDLCQRTKHLNYKMEDQWQFVQSMGPNKVIAVDFCRPLLASPTCVSYIFVVQNLFTKSDNLYPIKRANTKICLLKLGGDYF